LGGLFGIWAGSVSSKELTSQSGKGAFPRDG
jgi:hypothetical protein